MPAIGPPPLYLLAGGQSRRFGADKARAQLEGSPLICHVAQALRPACGPITAVAQAPGAYGDLGLATIADQRPGLGPVAGLHAALTHRGTGWLLLASCDTLGLRADWVELLVAAARPDASPPAVAFRHQGRWEPTFGLYHTDALGEVEGALEREQLALWRLLDALGARALESPEGWERVRSINTPEALESWGAES